MSDFGKANSDFAVTTCLQSEQYFFSCSTSITSGSNTSDMSSIIRVLLSFKGPTEDKSLPQFEQLTNFAFAYIVGFFVLRLLPHPFRFLLPLLQRSPF